MPLLKDSDFIGIFYCFSNFGTILIIIKRFRFYRNLLLFFEFRYYPYYKIIGIFYCFSYFGTILIKRFRFYRNLLLFFEFRYYPYYYYYYYYSFFPHHPIDTGNLRNRITFSHQTPLIHRPLSNNVQCAFRC